MVFVFTLANSASRWTVHEEGFSQKISVTALFPHLPFPSVSCFMKLFGMYTMVPPKMCMPKLLYFNELILLLKLK